MKIAINPSCLLSIALALFPVSFSHAAKPPETTPAAKTPQIRFDKNPERSSEPEVPLQGAVLKTVVQGLIPLEPGRDYRVASDKLFFTTRYAADLKGRTLLTLRFQDGSYREIILYAHDTSKTAQGIDFSPPAGTYDSPRRGCENPFHHRRQRSHRQKPEYWQSNRIRGPESDDQGPRLHQRQGTRPGLQRRIPHHQRWKIQPLSAGTHPRSNPRRGFLRSLRRLRLLHG
jgi:hypothetical protein